MSVAKRRSLWTSPTSDFIEKEGALAEGAGLVRPTVLPPPVLVAMEYIEGGWIVRASRPCLKLVGRGTGSGRMLEV